VATERAGSSCCRRFADLVGNRRERCGFQIVFLPPEYPDYPTHDVDEEDADMSVTMMKVRVGADNVQAESDAPGAAGSYVHYKIDMHGGVRRSFTGVTEDAWKIAIRDARS
jgi:hypothetical protein